MLKILILQALNVDNPQAYEKACSDWSAVTKETRRLAQDNDEAKQLRNDILKRGDRDPKRYNEHYQIVVSAIDDTPRPVEDYFLWLTSPSKSGKMLRFGDRMRKHEIKAHEDVLKRVHANRRAGHRRAFHLDRMELMKKDGYFDAVGSHYEKSCLRA